MIVNAKGRVCFVHDEPFAAIPIWIRYYKDNRDIEILFNNGMGAFVPLPVDDYLHECLLKDKKVLIVRMEEVVPVESFDTHLIVE